MSGELDLDRLLQSLTAQLVNPVSGFYHDHLFVPDGREQDALAILKTLAGRTD